MYLCVNDIDFAFFYDFLLDFCSYGVVFFALHFIFIDMYFIPSLYSQFIVLFTIHLIPVPLLLITGHEGIGLGSYGV